METNAASGGRIGGGNFRAPSSPSIPRPGGGNYRGYGNYRGGGIGFPFVLPFFGFGGGGLFGFLILTTIAGVIVNSIRRNGFENNSTIQPSKFAKPNQSSTSMIQLQIGLLAKAKGLQEDLRKIASEGTTATNDGLTKILQSTTLSLLRNPELWVYANAESGTVPFSSAEFTFNRLSLAERSKLKAELTTNYDGELSSTSNSGITPGEADESSEYIAITILLAAMNKINTVQINTVEDLTNNLQILGSISSSQLIALEIIWQPEGRGETLSKNELVTSYPNLKHL